VLKGFFPYMPLTKSRIIAKKRLQGHIRDVNTGQLAKAKTSDSDFVFSEDKGFSSDSCSDFEPYNKVLKQTISNLEKLELV